MGDTAPAPPTNRSNEELAMRELIIPELRRRWPSARIIHELPLRYSTRRIDLAAVTEAEINVVEIKSSRDVIDRLEAQLRGFLPIATRVIIALAPVWNEQLPDLVTTKQVKRICFGTPILVPSTSHVTQRTEAQEVVHRIGADHFETWTVDVAGQSIKSTRGGYAKNDHPWPRCAIDMLHVSELVEICSMHRLGSVPRQTHTSLVNTILHHLRGREVMLAVCRALRARAAFSAGTDVPVVVDAAADRALEELR